MDGQARTLIFGHRFDAPAAPPKAGTPAPAASAPPPLTEADLAEARARGFRDGHASAERDAASSAATRAADALAAIAARLDDAATTVRALAETHAEALARVVLDALAVAYPSIAARHDADEMRSFVATVLEPMAQAPALTIRVHPSILEALRADVARMHLRVVPEFVADAAMGPGDAHIAWQDGFAVRDAARAWDAIANVLRPLGLLTEAEDAAA